MKTSKASIPRSSNNSLKWEPKFVEIFKGTAPGRLLFAMLKAGTVDLKDKDQIRRIRVLNTLSFLTASLVILIVSIYYYLTRKNIILIPALIEAALFYKIIYINHLKKYLLASVLMYTYQVIFAVYFGMLLGKVVEVSLMIIFLCISTYLALKSKRLIKFCMSISLLALIALEVDYYFEIFDPIHLDRQTEYLFRWLSIGGITTLISVVIHFYKSDNETYRKQIATANARQKRQIRQLARTNIKFKRANVTLGSVNIQLEEANAELAATNKELADVNTRLEVANKAQHTFLSTMNHELRTPLNNIHAAAQLMQRDVRLKNDLQPMLSLANDLYQSSTEAKGIVNSVLDWAQIETGKLDTILMEHFVLRNWIEKTIGNIKYYALSKSIRVVTKLSDQLPQVVISSSGKLSLIFTNLLSNAIKYSPKNSRVDVNVTCDPDHLFIEVTNTGKGISALNLPYIFEKFVREDNRDIEGTGLGLYNIKNWVENLFFGSITAKSTPGELTSFRLSLPMVIGNIENVVIDTEDEHRDLTDIKVLVMEDNEVSLSLTANFLQGMGCTVFKAMDGAQGLALARDHKPDAILIDSQMPVLNGVETLIQLKQDDNLKEIPAIVISGNTLDDAIRKMLELGAIDYITKPFDLSTLRDKISKHIKDPLQQLQE